VVLNLRPFPRDYLPLELAIEPGSPDAIDKAYKILDRIVATGPGVQYALASETGQIWVRANSEKDLEAALAELRNAQAAFTVGAPQIAYCEMLSAPVEIDHTHDRNAGGAPQFARVRLRFEPNPRSMSNAFINSANAEAVPPEFAPGVEAGYRAVLNSGPLLGFPVVACRAVLLDGAWREGASTLLAFEIAARAAFREAGEQAEFKLFEPYLQIDITTRDVFSDDVIADFRSRRGVNTAKEAGAGMVAIYGFVRKHARLRGAA
jgi:elongation factor G